MTSREALDAHCRKSIEFCIGVLGLEQASLVLLQACNEAADSTQRQVFSLDGGMAKEIGELAKSIPGAAVAYKTTENGIQISLTSQPPHTEESVEQIRLAMIAIHEKYNKIPGALSENLTIDIFNPKTEPEE